MHPDLLGAHMAGSLVLNLLPVEVPAAELTCGVQPYVDEDQLRVLRNTNRTTHVVLRDGERIVAAPHALHAPVIGNPAPVRLDRELWLSSRLLEESLLQHLLGLPREVIDDSPVTFFGTRRGDDVLGSAAEGMEVPRWLGVRVGFRFKARVLRPDPDVQRLFIAIDVRTRNLITANCSALTNDGVRLEGLYVGQQVPSRDPRVRPRFEALGRVQSIAGDQLVLTDSRPGHDRVALAEAYLDPRYEAFHACLRHVFGRSCERVESRLSDLTGSIMGGKGRLERIQAAARYLAKADIRLSPGVRVTLGELARPSPSHGPFQFSAARGPTYVFDQGGRRTDSSSSRGLERYGPYSQLTHTPTNPKACVVFSEDKKGQVEQFLRKLIGGVQTSGRRKNPFELGLVRRYGLRSVDLEYFAAKGRTAEAYREAARRAVEWQAERGGHWDIAFVQVEDSFRDRPDHENPYFTTKAVFFSHQVPVQEFKIETARLNENRIGYVLGNMALATYAKLGGIPWILKSDETVPNEVVIGLGSASIGEGRFSQRARMVGVTTVFTGDGRYFLSNLSRVTTMETYREAVLDGLRTVIERLEHDLGWRKGDHLRVIFHAFKPLRNMEAEAVQALLAAMSGYDVECAFLTVVEDHPFVLFDERQGGVRDPSGREKGVFAPSRGSFLHLSDYETLIALTGPHNLKRWQDGMPRPLVLRLHRLSTFVDMTYLARQAFVFSGHSWRGFHAVPKPVTILYSELMADLLGHLGRLPNWNADAMFGRLGRTRWFL